MQVYKAPLKDYKFLIKDFLNTTSRDQLFKNSDIDQNDLNTKKVVFLIKAKSLLQKDLKKHIKIL